MNCSPHIDLAVSLVPFGGVVGATVAAGVVALWFGFRSKHPTRDDVFEPLLDRINDLRQHGFRGTRAKVRSVRLRRKLLSENRESIRQRLNRLHREPDVPRVS